MKKVTKLYIDGKQVRRKDLKVRGLSSRITYLRDMCFLNDMSVAQNFTLSSGKNLKILVTSKKKRK